MGAYEGYREPSVENQLLDHLSFFHWQRDLSFYKNDGQAVIEWNDLYSVYDNLEKSTYTTPLMFAAHMGLEQIMPTLLRYFVHTSRLKNSTGATALMFAAEKGYTKIVQMLLPYSDVNAANNEKVTALMLAAQNNEYNTVCVLLNDVGMTNEAINAIDYEGVTALMLAVRNGNKSVVYKLLNAGASMKVLANDNHTAWTLAALYNNHQCLTHMVHILRKDPSQKDVYNGPEKALQIAARLGHLEVVKMLVIAHLDMFGTDSKGNTPLMLAVKYHRVSVVSFLIAFTKTKLRHTTKFSTYRDFVQQTNQNNTKAYKLAEEAQDKDIMQIFESAGMHIQLDPFPTALGNLVRRNHQEIMKSLPKNKIQRQSKKSPIILRPNVYLPITSKRHIKKQETDKPDVQMEPRSPNVIKYKT